jgi:drug/metabolite transporter (DMT)-like permease
MTFGYLLLVGALMAFAVLGIFHKVADHPECRPGMIALALFFWGAIFTGLDTCLREPGGLHFPPKVLAIGGAAGLFATLALFAFQTGLKFGKISTSWLVLNLSMSLPILVSIVFFGEKLNWIKMAGVAMVLLAILMLWFDKKTDMTLHGGNNPAVRGHHTKWLFLMILAFVFNGLAGLTQKVLVEAGQKDFTWQFYTTLYVVALLLTTGFAVVKKMRPTRREIITGFIMAVGSVAGNVLITLALGNGVAAAVAFPVGNGGSLTLVVLAGVLFFKERIHPVGRLGIACGICAILVLVMEPQILEYLGRQSAR